MRRPGRRVGTTRALHVVVLVLLLGSGCVGTARAADDQPSPTCAAGDCLDPLFTVQFPHARVETTSTGVRVPFPVHYYDAALFATIGTGDLKTEHALTASTDFHPVETTSGHGIAALLMADYLDSDVGPYHEALIAFPVHEGQKRVVADDPGAMAAAVFDPANGVWGVRLLLDRQEPIDAGRELLGIPKVKTPASMPLSITPSHVAFAFAQPDGTPIASGDVVLENSKTEASAFDLATQPNLASIVNETAKGGYLHVRFAYRDVRDPGVTAFAEVAARAGTRAQVALAPYGDNSTITANRGAPFGSDLAALALHPLVSLVVENLHMALDAHL